MCTSNLFLLTEPFNVSIILTNPGNYFLGIGEPETYSKVSQHMNHNIKDCFVSILWHSDFLFFIKKMLCKTTAVQSIRSVFKLWFTCVLKKLRWESVQCNAYDQMFEFFHALEIPSNISTRRNTLIEILVYLQVTFHKLGRCENLVLQMDMRKIKV